MSRPALTLWSGGGPRAAVESRDARALLERCRPPVVILHGRPDDADHNDLADDGPRLTELLRARLPGVEVWWGIAGDAAGTSPGAAWARVGHAAVAAHVACLIPDLEELWKRAPKGAARTALDGLADAVAGGIPLGHTTYPDPVSIVVDRGPPVRRWGGHSEFPWEECLGDGSPVVWAGPQVYWGNDAAPRPRGTGPKYLGWHRESWDKGIAKGWIRADLPRFVYLQAHGCQTADLCTVGEAFPTTCWWAAPTRVDALGADAIFAQCVLHRLGGAAEAPTIVDFQRRAGLVADGIVGPKTLAALRAADAALTAEPPAPDPRPLARAFVNAALARVGNRYVFGAQAPYADPAYAGPWDCAELATWAYYQATGKLFGVLGSDTDPARADAYSGAWIEDARAFGTVLSTEDAARVVGAVLLRARRGETPGHVAISCGDGTTVEAMSTARGVARGLIAGRSWTLCATLPGLRYEPAGPA